MVNLIPRLIEGFKTSSEIRKYLIYPVIGIIVSFFFTLLLDCSNKSDALRNKKIDIISELAQTSSDYYYYSSVRAMIQMSKVDIIRHFVDTPFNGLSFVYTPIEKRMIIQDSLRKKFPTAYDIMLEGDKKFPEFQKSMLLTQLFFSEKVKQKAIKVSEYIPIDKKIDAELKKYQERNKGKDISENDRGEILEKLNNELELLISELINEMNKEI